MLISKATFAGSSTRLSEKPARKGPEFAFIGRSNVGKSSLINMLCGQKDLAHTSATPGKTHLINHFLINDSWYLGDLPGYGFAKIGQKRQEALKTMIQDFIGHSPELRRLMVLIDCRHDLQDIDASFITAAHKAEVPMAIIFTKGDKLSSAARKLQTAKIVGQIRDAIGIEPEHFTTSATSRFGKEEILNYIETCLKIQ